MICLDTAVKIVRRLRNVVEQALACRTIDFLSYSSCSVLKFERAETLILLSCLLLHAIFSIPITDSTDYYHWEIVKLYWVLVESRLFLLLPCLLLYWLHSSILCKLLGINWKNKSTLLWEENTSGILFAGNIQALWITGQCFHMQKSGREQCNT